MEDEQLSGADAALWHTCSLAAARAAGAPVHPLVDSPLRPQLAPGEVLLAAGPFTRYVLTTGDGAYARSSAFFFATGAVGLAATAAVAVGQAWGNARRRRQAQREAATPRWREAGSGLLTVSTHGFYLSGTHDVSPWPYEAVDSCAVGRRSLVDLTGRSTTGPVRWLLESDWAELMFVMWALSARQDHPQLRDGTWLPSGWLDRVAGERGAGWPGGPPEVGGGSPPLLGP